MNRQRILPALLIILTGVIAYWNSFDGAFVYDDQGSIRDNPHIRVLWPLGKAMSLPLWSSASTVDGRPLLSLTFALNRRFLGPEPWGYHLVNLAIHIAAGLLLFGVVRRTLDLPQFREHVAPRGTWLALATALIWVVHPLQTESVTYIVQRAESLMGMLFLLTLYCAMRGFEGRREGGERRTSNVEHRTSNGGRRPSAPWCAAAVAACAVGMGVKQTMISAPLLVLLYDVVFVSESLRSALARRRRFYTALFATCLIVFGIVGATWTESTSDFVAISPVRYLFTQALVLLHYLRLAVWPSPLVLSYGWTLEDQWPRIVFPGLAILGLLGAMFHGLRRRRWQGFVLAWFFFILAPTSSIAPTRQAAFEHRMYLSLAAVVVLVVLGAEQAIRRVCATSKQAALLGGGLTAAVVLAFGVLTHNRNKDYHSALAMWEGNLSHRPNAPLARLNYGNALHNAGRHEEALAHYRDGLLLQPELAGTHINLGNALTALGRHEEAIAHYRQAAQLNPGLAVAYYNLGHTYHTVGRTGDAITHYRHALDLQPDTADAHCNLGFILEETGQIREAMDHYRAALRIEPGRTEIHVRLGNALQESGHPAESIAHYRHALKLKPDHADAHNNLGNALQALGQAEESIPHYREALRRAPGDATIHYNLGRAHQKLDQPAAAIGHYRQALQLKPDMADAHYNQGNVLAALGREEEAIEQYRRVVGIDSEHVGAHNNLGALYRETGRLAEAVEHLEHAVRLRPANAVVRENLRRTRALMEEATREEVENSP